MKKLVNKIKDTLSIFSSSKGFTLLELLVVVLIIGILAGIALPQYEMAVTKSRAMSMLPLMRRWYDALQEYKLQHGSYCKIGQEDDCDTWPDGSDLGVNWPSDWKNSNNDEDSCGDSDSCYDNTNTWSCYINGGDDGSVACNYYKNDTFSIIMNQADGGNYCGGNQGKIICIPHAEEGEKICKNLGRPSGTEGDLQCTVLGS